MPLKKTLLSIAMLCFFGACAGYEHAHNDSADLLTLMQGDLSGRRIVANTSASSAAPAQPASQDIATAPAQSAYQPPVQYGEDGYEGGGEDGRHRQVASTQTQAAAPQRTQTQTQTAAQPAAQAAPPPQPQGQYRNGIYTGSVADAYYGLVQVQATISGGKLTDVQFLQYPSDRSTSRFINSQAMPLLTQEAIQAQSANVSGVSGATDTSGAFVQSLGTALAQAHA